MVRWTSREGCTGVMASQNEGTVDGYDVQMQTNHLSHFLLTRELLPLLERGAELRGEARVVNHSSTARKVPPLPLWWVGSRTAGRAPTNPAAASRSGRRRSWSGAGARSWGGWTAGRSHWEGGCATSSPSWPTCASPTPSTPASPHAAAASRRSPATPARPPPRSWCAAPTPATCRPRRKAAYGGTRARPAVTALVPTLGPARRCRAAMAKWPLTARCAQARTAERGVVSRLGPAARAAFLRACRLVSQSSEDGSMPLLRCCCDPGAQSGDFFGCEGLFRGRAVRRRPERACTNARACDTLWERSAAAVGAAVAETTEAGAGRLAGRGQHPGDDGDGDDDDDDDDDTPSARLERSERGRAGPGRGVEG
eukprot:scaffold523_cov446-Prasinococcus_capsulatus_cf.AAC.6